MNDADSNVNCIAIISPGDMGHAVGRTLVDRGMDVIACVGQRSPRTRSLAEKACLRAVDDLDQLVHQADLILSILVPNQAVAAATEIAESLAKVDRTPLFADCNAISPETSVEIGRIVTDAGGDYVDACLIGFPPGGDQVTRLYASGPGSSKMTALSSASLEVITLGDQVGLASGLKMCYAALTKGTFALYYAIAIAGERMGLLQPLLDELQFSQARQFEVMQRQLPRLPAKAYRWIGEMEQIAETFGRNGVPVGFHEAAADIYRLIAQSPLAQDTPETIDENRTLSETIRAIR